MPRQKRPTASTWPASDSRFLNLPAEVRNSVYEYAAQHTRVISLRKGQLLYAPPLSLVCKQVRKEYEEIFLDEGPRYAPHVRIHITNFIHKDVAPSYLSLPALAEWFDRDMLTSSLVIHLTNTFDSYLQHLRQMLVQSHCIGNTSTARPLPAKCRYEIAVDQRTFDVAYVRRILPRLHAAHGNHPNYGPVTRNDWSSMLMAFEKAFPGCTQQITRRSLSPISPAGKRPRLTISTT